MLINLNSSLLIFWSTLINNSREVGTENKQSWLLDNQLLFYQNFKKFNNLKMQTLSNMKN